MPKSKSNKKRKNRVIAFKNKIQADRRKIRESFIKGLEEAHAKEMEEKIKSNQSETVVDGLNEFSLDESTEKISPPLQLEQVSDDLSKLGLDGIQQVELTGAPPDSFAGIINTKTQ
jgi:hypothetical protein